MSEKSLEVNRRYALSIQLTNPPGALEFLSIETICRWCRLEQNAGFYDAGFEFAQLDEQARSTVAAIIRTLCFRNEPGTPA
jgi:hypothetical protein